MARGGSSSHVNPARLHRVEHGELHLYGIHSPLDEALGQWLDDALSADPASWSEETQQLAAYRERMVHAGTCPDQLREYALMDILSHAESSREHGLPRQMRPAMRAYLSSLEGYASQVAPLLLDEDEQATLQTQLAAPKEHHRLLRRMERMRALTSMLASVDTAPTADGELERLRTAAQMQDIYWPALQHDLIDPSSREAVEAVLPGMLHAAITSHRVARQRNGKLHDIVQQLRAGASEADLMQDHLAIVTVPSDSWMQAISPSDAPTRPAVLRIGETLVVSERTYNDLRSKSQRARRRGQMAVMTEVVLSQMPDQPDASDAAEQILVLAQAADRAAHALVPTGGGTHDEYVSAGPAAELTARLALPSIQRQAKQHGTLLDAWRNERAHSSRSQHSAWQALISWA